MKKKLCINLILVLIFVTLFSVSFSQFKFLSNVDENSLSKDSGVGVNLIIEINDHVNMDTIHYYENSILIISYINFILVLIYGSKTIDMIIDIKKGRGKNL